MRFQKAEVEDVDCVARVEEKPVIHIAPGIRVYRETLDSVLYPNLGAAERKSDGGLYGGGAIDLPEK